jgi:hypothetical protein
MASRPQPYLAAAALALLFAAPVRAEIIVLASGQTLSAKGHREEGDRLILQLRSGGEVTCDKTLVDRIVPDEVPPDEPQEPVAAEEAAAAAEVPAAPAIPMGPYGEIITAVAQTHGVDPLLVRALIHVESGDRPRARSHKGAMGLMQLMPSTARQYRLRNPYDPKANIAAGVKHLKSLLDRWNGAVDLALAAYNAGEGAVKKFNGVPPYRETRNYVSRILALAGLGGQ